MTVAAIIHGAAGDGVNLTLSGSGGITATGNRAAVARWADRIRAHKPEIVAALRSAANDSSAPDIVAPRLTNDPDASRRWVITIPDRDPVTVIVVQGANADEMRAMYPTATSIVAAFAR